ncbi:MAG: hypothetical protein AAF600_12520 [Bacteroidota bacterium]
MSPEKIARSLASAISNIRGVSFTSTGSNVQPIIHGLYGNRILLWHTRHRSIDNAFNRAMACLAVYHFLDKGSSLSMKNKREMVLSLVNSFSE